MLKTLGIGVKCPRCDQTLPPMRWPASFSQAMWGGWTCKHCSCEVDSRGREKTKKKKKKTKKNKGDEPVLRVRLDPAVERRRVGEEEVNVPADVNIKVSRKRTIEHSVEVTDKTTTTMSTEAGMASGVWNMKASVMQAIERAQGRKYAESEEVSYEVELHGGADDRESSRYTLVWTECWRTGVVEMEDKSGATIELGTIRFKEAAVLEVQRAPATPTASATSSSPGVQALITQCASK